MRVNFFFCICLSSFPSYSYSSASAGECTSWKYLDSLYLFFSSPLLSSPFSFLFFSPPLSSLSFTSYPLLTPLLFIFLLSFKYTPPTYVLRRDYVNTHDDECGGMVSAFHFDQTDVCLPFARMKGREKRGRERRDTKKGRVIDWKGERARWRWRRGLMHRIIDSGLIYQSNASHIAILNYTSLFPSPSFPLPSPPLPSLCPSPLPRPPSLPSHSLFPLLPYGSDYNSPQLLLARVPHQTPLTIG